MTPMEEWACTYIGSRDSNFFALSDTEKLRENFFLSGRLDSMALMNMLLDAEQQFAIAFTAEAFQDRRIQTISGLSEVISEIQHVS